MTPDDMAALHAVAFSTTRAWSAAEFNDLLAHPGTLVKGDCQCFALLRIVLDEAEILTIATHPTKRRQGLARKTLSESEAQSKSQGATKVFLEVAEDNTSAISLYTSTGYAQIGRRPGYYMPKDGAPIAALVFAKSLTTT
ncbi:ribosomal-protein-alanine N-acetyltransferase [Yoonia maricola]|uniref:Ribosomal-protein-alanine N-acetyltransferase n=1 Tax=Yoonia maricola TaxID=420999 RepID=A0A2M8W330_9RHOB|nr:GNAT family N-acetyltransferase [Yoonia maricola]PJI85318.1 ribosomal-protein-alanine N-acetyltransferase [Yoonia maricola]